MADLSIDRLSLHLSGLSEYDSRRLAQLIADGLGRAALPAGTEGRESMEATVKANPGASLESLSDQIVAGIVRQLERSF